MPDWSVHAVLEDLGLLVTALGGILALTRSLLRMWQPRAAAPARPPRKVNWGWLLAGLAFFVLCAIFLGLQAYSPKLPLLLIGSGNVQSYLTERVPDLKRLRPVMLDVGSGTGTKLALQADQFGDNSLSKNADLLVVLSSAGDSWFEDGLKKPLETQSGNAAWLSIHIADPPLTLMYTLATDSQQGTHLPEIKLYEIEPYKYHYVSCAGLKKYYDTFGGAGVVSALNEDGTGTLHNVKEACSWQTNPADMLQENGNNAHSMLEKQVHASHFLEDLSSALPPMDLRSWTPVSARTGRAATCDDLKKNRLRTAALCADCGGPSSLKRANFVVIMKLDSEEKSGKYKIASEPACKLAEALTSKVKSCEFNTGDASWVNYGKNRLGRISSVEEGSKEIPDFLSCQ